MSNWFAGQLSGIDWNTLGLNLVKSTWYILKVLILARLSYIVIIYFLRRLLVQRTGKILINERKANTLFPLLRSITFYVITFTFILSILKNVFSIETGTLLASASVLGVALGFGAQSFIKDIIGGFFILFEDQYAVGEYIKAGEFSGTVEEIGIRATRLRDWSGELHIIPNGSITAVTNFNRGKMRALVDIHLPYDEDIDHAMEVMHKVCDEVAGEYKDKIVDKPSVQGVIQFGEHNAVLRVIAYTKPNEQWELERELRRRVHKAFLNEGIRIPQAYTFKLHEK
ncbi:MAG: mechanosensitive ion channel family protein [Desulfitobacterium hafniense]|nr:mechanosensitive ion channel family protein [Desulfitobacterium hafniense]